MPATPEEIEQVRRFGETLKDEHLAETLMDLYAREEGLLDTKAGMDPEMREITVHNMSVLAGSAARILAFKEKASIPI
ncbi:MAG: hypothetical protein BWY99_01673 [Synergistetes bacterium ADurb.BinA166]|nr:MAG: hypothetical protein BWY99_01673 [Synergistetes bacterium ADurb.BinA166]